jgi:uncharacterized membrane protein
MRNYVALRLVAVAVVLTPAVPGAPGDVGAAQSAPGPTSTTTAASTTSSTSSISTSASTTSSATTTTTTEPTPAVADDSDGMVTSPPADEIAATGGSTRTVVRVGALLFAVGGIATFVAAGKRPHRRPEPGS